MHWYVDVLKKYAVFSGRTQRQEYWMFTLFNIIITLVLFIIAGVIATALEIAAAGLLPNLYTLAVLLPGIAVTVRRLHDTGRSGWWLLIAFVPFIGAIVLLVFYVQDSQPGENQFGPNPKESVA
ncbi:MAG: DUF805 domain-containing protein [Candidatus Hydrogenedentes bacterium]|nr:DUF805 domain-containing protein [Candidatus Hydrogenedentota bacterium]